MNREQSEVRGRLLVVAILLVGSASVASAVSSEYRMALESFTSREYARAEPMFRAIVERDAPDPETIKARYFLARTLMEKKQWKEASTMLIEIYSRFPSFYRQWGCDFLLGECRRALGQD